MKYLIAIDFETTGLSPSNGDAIVEIGAVKFDLESGIIDEYSSLVNPQRSIPAEASNIHGIKNIDVADAAVIAIEWSRFTTWADDPHALVAHNAVFEKSFINSFSPIDVSPAIFLDTLKYSRLAFPSLANHKLKTVCDHIGYRLIDAHRALPDAKATARLLIEIYRRQPHLFDEFLDIEKGEHESPAPNESEGEQLAGNSNISETNVYEGDLQIAIERYELVNGDVYEGECLDGLPSGRGRCESANGDVYEGEWEDGKHHGRGRQDFANGDVYEGEWMDGLISGQGRYQTANGSVYEGDFLYGEHPVGRSYSNADEVTELVISEDDVIRNKFRVALARIAEEEVKRIAEERAKLDYRKSQEKEAMEKITKLLKLLKKQVGDVQGLDIWEEERRIITIVQGRKSTADIKYDPMQRTFYVWYGGFYFGKNLWGKSKCEYTKTEDEVMERVIEFVGRHIIAVQTREIE